MYLFVKKAAKKGVLHASVYFCCMLALVSASVSATAHAQSSANNLTSEQRAKVVASCVVVKNTLEQLHASDALLRVNRGQVYESMASNLMEPFNARLASNRLDTAATTTVTQQYRANLNAFRTDYIAYEQQLSGALKIDCTSRPDDFYLAVVTARSLRAVVHNDVQKLYRSIDDYRSSVNDFLVNYERVSQ